MKQDLKSLFGLLCTAVHWLRSCNSRPSTRFLGSYARALLVSQDGLYLCNPLIGWLLDDQAFSPSYDLALPLYPRQDVSLSQSSCVSPSNLPRERIGEEPHHMALLQGLTRFFATQTGCRWLISYIEQKKFLACGPEFSVDLSAPPEFSGGVTEKYLSTGWARTFDLQIR